MELGKDASDAFGALAKNLTDSLAGIAIVYQFVFSATAARTILSAESFASSLFILSLALSLIVRKSWCTYSSGLLLNRSGSRKLNS